MLANREEAKLDNKLSGKEPSEFLTVAEAAELMKVSPQTIYAWRKKGKIKISKAGRKLLIDK